MRVLGMIMIILGIMLAGLLLIFFWGSALENGGIKAISNTDIAFAAILLGTPCILLIKYGIKLWRRRTGQTPEDADDHSVINIRSPQVLQPLAGALQPTLPINPKPRPVVCKNCGASGQLILGQETACEYCGTIL